MKHSYNIFVLMYLFLTVGCNQNSEEDNSPNKNEITLRSELFHQNLYENYEHYHLPELNYRRIKRKDIEPFIEKYKNNNLFDVSTLGTSVEGREINLVKLGDGPTKVLLWSQMHGDESTATRALFEIFRFFSSDDSLNSYKKEILDETTLYFIPMLNPDGAEEFERRNALSIDLNRDALRLTSPESKILKEVRDKYEPEFGFNLHDQSKYYNVYRTGKQASISFLAPAYNYEKDINKGRREAMKLIVSMNDVIQNYLPGHVGRYDDAFEPRAFGDNIQKWGTNTILIESGGYPGDPEKKELVKMNFVIILHALHQISIGGYLQASTDEYFQIPENDRKFFDLLIRKVRIEKNGKDYIFDLGINHYEFKGEKKTIQHRAVIENLGDLSTYYGYEELNAQGMKVMPGETYSKVLQSSADITPVQAKEWLRNGYLYVKANEIEHGEESDHLPIITFHEREKVEPETPDLGSGANFLIKKGETVIYAVINGRIIKL